jgi:hypothetical protein
MGRWSRRAALAGLLLALVGVWGAWVPHRAAALVLSGWDLAEFVKFLPGTSMTREVFYLPVWCIGIALALIAAQPRTKAVLRVPVIALALALMVALLPPYPYIWNGYQHGEFRWRFVLGVSGLLFVMGSLFSPRLLKDNGRSWALLTGALLAGLALLGALPSLRQFLQVRGTIEALYGAALGWGWGLTAFLSGWIVVGVVGARMLLLGSRA